MRQRGLPFLLKRLADRTIASVALVVSAPVIATAAIAVRCTMGAPAFFTHERPGLHGKPFRIHKLRTMSDARDAKGELLPDDDRLTRVGRLLRTTSIDELPQLWNVVKGDLSIVGPRPLMMEYLKYYSRQQARRHDVLPGITGWAQVHGRNATDWEERFDYDVWYVDNWSLALDLRIIEKTVMLVLRRECIDAAGGIIMPRFRGTKSETN